MTARVAERIAAIARGEKTYRTGKPCRRGHTAERYVSNNICSECQSLNALAWKQKNGVLQRQQLAAWRADNRERESESHANWLKENRGLVLLHKKVRLARKRAHGGSLSSGIIQRLMLLQRRRCACCGIDISRAKYHLDHIEALAVGGANEDRNVQLLCPTCNMSKHVKHPIDFMRSRGFLL